MISRSFDGRYYDACRGAPPPLHVYTPEAEHAAWHPLSPPYPMMPVQHPVEMVRIPQPGPGDPLGDDPTDPACGRIHTTGMIGRFHPTVGGQ